MPQEPVPRIRIMPLESDSYLATRQLRMVNGLLKCGVTLGEIKALQWYEPRLEDLYPVDTLPVDRAVHEPVNVDNVDTETVHNIPVDTPVVDRRKAYKRNWMAKKRGEAKDG